jgi:pimeloyl-ACP methyl ester carboxylesterase
VPDLTAASSRAAAGRSREVVEVRWRSSDGHDLCATVHTDTANPPASTDSGLPVVLLHGLAQQRHFWDPVVARLRAVRISTLDQRGHGDSGIALDADYRIERCADDVLEFMDQVGWPRAVVIGHSWGASVALSTARSGRVAGIGLIDGGLWGPASLGDRASVREALRPPGLGIPEDELWAMVDQSAPYLDDQARAALAHTFEADQQGLLRTRIGVDRHMRVLDGLLDYLPDDDLAGLRCPTWAVVCEPAGNEHDRSDDRAWARAKSAALARASKVSGLLVHRWMGAVHDVPLQWPALVAGFIDALQDSVSRRESTHEPGRVDRNTGDGNQVRDHFRRQA